MVLFSSQMQFFQVNWRLLSLLSIFQLLVKYTTIVNAEFPLNMARTLSRQSRKITRTIEVLIFPHNFTPKSVFSFCTLHLKPTNLEVRYLIQATESLVFTNVEIAIFCAVQETSRRVINKLRVQKRFRI